MEELMSKWQGNTENSSDAFDHAGLFDVDPFPCVKQEFVDEPLDPYGPPPKQNHQPPKENDKGKQNSSEEETGESLWFWTLYLDDCGMILTCLAPDPADFQTSSTVLSLSSTSWRGNPFLHAIHIFLAPQHCVSLRRLLDNIGVVLAAKRALTGPICDLSRLILTVNLEAYGVRLPKRAAGNTPPRHYGSISIIVKDSHVVDVKSTIP
ncbi:MAG: hypothetical protein L6R42_005799, partial [Xanthoria sp. 1 TBL-2021]